MNRCLSRTDALGATESYVYDGNGNLVQSTDRRGKVTAYSYDGLNRRTFAGFGQSGGNYESTIGYTWDGGDRMTQAVDSIAGPITKSYDGLDQLTQEQTPQGTVSYTYDNADRRATMAVTGQSSVNYSYDNANRLSGITQGSAGVSFAGACPECSRRNNANRRTCLTLPNGVIASYGYDTDSHVTSITYGTGGSCSAPPSNLGNLTYTYDAAGRVMAKAGSLATVTLPANVSGNTFNADNEMTAFNGTALSYDPNGNLTADGTNTYTWDARNHLTAISGVVGASFVYDAMGRRASKTISGTTTQFLYDRLNPVQELSAGNPPTGVTANLLTGLGIDEYFSRSDSSA